MDQPLPVQSPLVVGPPTAEHAWVRWAVVFIFSLALYAATASRGVQWQDSGSRILRVYTGDLYGSLGLALSHPLHFWIARGAVAISPLEPDLTVTLLSGLAAALAVANVFGCVRSLTGRSGPALFAAASLALANTFWQLATLAETYTLTSALLAAECWCLVLYLRARRPGWLAAAMFCNGLGLANHLLAVLTLPVLVAVAFWRPPVPRWRWWLSAKLAWLVGSLPYTGLVAHQILVTGDLRGTVRSALFGTAYAGNVLNTSISVGLLAVSLGFVALNFPNLFLPAAAVGLVRGRRAVAVRDAFWPLLAALVIHAGFVLRYNIKDQQTFFLPMYTLLAMFAGLGAAQAAHWAARRWLLPAAVVLLAATPGIYALFIQQARTHDLLAGRTRNRPYRDDYTYLFAPWSIAERSAERMATHALELAGPDGLIVMEDRMGAFAVRYKAARADLKGVSILDLPRMKTSRAITHWLTAQGWPQRRSAVVLVPTDTQRVEVPAPEGWSWQAAGELRMLARPAAPN